jgi:hypothetical protein
MKKLVVILSALAACGPVFAAPPTSELKGIALGETRDDVLKGTDYGCASTWSRSLCTWQTTLAGASAKIQVMFNEDDRVEMISVMEIDADDFDQVLAGLRAKFGKASSCHKGVVTNLAGARLDNLECSWTFRGWRIGATKRSRMTESSVTLTSDVVLKRAAQGRGKPADDM